MNNNEKSNYGKMIKDLTASGVCLALCMFLPLLTLQIPQIGSALSPMHIPVLLCGFISGPYYAAVIGLISPLLRFVLFSMPPIMPVGIAMCFELAVYGLVSGLLYKKLPKKIGFIYVSLIAAMFVGRVVWGTAFLVISGISGSSFTWAMFMSGAFINAAPGIVLHIILIPLVIIGLRKAKYMT